MVNISPHASALDAHRVVGRVNVHTSHAREIGDDTIIHGAEAGTVVAASAHRQGQSAIAGEIDRADDIGDIYAADDERRVFVDHPIVDFARLVILRVAWTDQVAAHLRLQDFNCFIIHATRHLLSHRFPPSHSCRRNERPGKVLRNRRDCAPMSKE
jgi:hypothetical protein